MMLVILPKVWGLRCPTARAFDYGGGASSAIIFSFFLSLVIALGIFGVSSFNICSDTIRRRLQGKKRITSVTLSLKHPRAARNYAVAAFVALPVGLSPFVVLEEHCAAPSGIFVQENPWSGFKRYDWSDVASLVITCELDSAKGRSSYWLYDFTARVKGGAQVHVGGGISGEAPPLSVRELSSALNGLPFQTDVSRIPRGCKPPTI